MDEEFDTSVDTSDVGTSADMDTSDVVDDVPDDIPEDIPEDVPEDEPEMTEEDDLSDDIPEDVPEEQVETEDTTTDAENIDSAEPTEDIQDEQFEDTATDEISKETTSKAEDTGSSEQAEDTQDEPLDDTADDPSYDVDNGDATELTENTQDDTATDKTAEEDDGTDWERTSLHPEEKALLREMEENGEIEVLRENPDLKDPEHTELHLPTESTGEFLGKKGNSEFKPVSEEALSRMKQYGRDTVEYKDGYPDFSPFTTHDSEWGKIDGQVEIGHMTDNRDNPSLEYGKRPRGAGHDPSYDLGNFSQADNEIAEWLKEGHPNITGKDIEKYRKEKHLTWHECADGKTMMLVPEEIHSACRHSGGVSEMKYRMAWGDVSRPID